MHNHSWRNRVYDQLIAFLNMILKDSKVKDRTVNHARKLRGIKSTELLLRCKVSSSENLEANRILLGVTRASWWLLNYIVPLRYVDKKAQGCKSVPLGGAVFSTRASSTLFMHARALLKRARFGPRLSERRPLTQLCALKIVTFFHPLIFKTGKIDETNSFSKCKSYFRASICV